MRSIQQGIELYNAENGSYPATQSVALTSGSWGAGSVTYADANCPYNLSGPAGGTLTIKTTEWVPGIEMSLPQSNGERRESQWGCFFYQSDGSRYVLSAWNMVGNGPQTSTMYRRVGFREAGQYFQVYYCNHAAIGGRVGGVYDINRDFYKYSYTISNITNCNETPPAGA